MDTKCLGEQWACGKWPVKVALHGPLGLPKEQSSNGFIFAKNSRSFRVAFQRVVP